MRPLLLRTRALTEPHSPSGPPPRQSALGRLNRDRTRRQRQLPPATRIGRHTPRSPRPSWCPNPRERFAGATTATTRTGPLVGEWALEADLLPVLEELPS